MSVRPIHIHAIRFAVCLLPLALYLFPAIPTPDMPLYRVAAIFLCGFWLGGVTKRLEKQS